MRHNPTVIVLAAGRGTRFGGPTHKLAQPLAGASVLGTTIGHVLASELPLLVVTTQALVGEAAPLVASRDILVLPDDERRGMGESLAAGVAARADAQGWLVLPGDMPAVQPETLRAVAEALELQAVVYAQYRGRRGHPVGFAAELFSELVQLTGDEGARRVVARFPSVGVEVDDPGVLLDVDTHADLAQVRASAAPGLRRRA